MRCECEQAALRASFGGRALVRLGLKRAERPGVLAEFGAGGLAWIERGVSRRTLARNPRNTAAAATAGLFAKIVAALREGREPPSSAAEARDVIEVVAAAYESAASGSRVELTPRASADAVQEPQRHR